MYRITNLMFRAKIEESCSRLGLKCKNASGVQDLEESLRDWSNVLIICDLVSSRPELESIIRVGRTKPSKILGYYPHIDRDTEAYARSVGVDYVVPRSAFQAKINQLLS